MEKEKKYLRKWEKLFGKKVIRLPADQTNDHKTNDPKKTLNINTVMTDVPVRENDSHVNAQLPSDARPAAVGNVNDKSNQTVTSNVVRKDESHVMMGQPTISRLAFAVNETDDRGGRKDKDCFVMTDRTMSQPVARPAITRVESNEEMSDQLLRKYCERQVMGILVTEKALETGTNTATGMAKTIRGISNKFNGEKDQSKRGRTIHKGNRSLR